MNRQATPHGHIREATKIGGVFINTKKNDMEEPKNLKAQFLKSHSGSGVGISHKSFYKLESCQKAFCVRERDFASSNGVSSPPLSLLYSSKSLFYYLSRTTAAQAYTRSEFLACPKGNILHFSPPLDMMLARSSSALNFIAI